MKRSLIFIIAIFCCFGCYAQTNPQSTLALQVVVEDMVEPFPVAAKAQMQSTLSNILTKNGLQSSSWQNQFFITASVVPQTKEILAGPPTQIVEVMDVVFYIGDSYNELVFASTELTVKGVGSTEAKAYLNALSTIKSTSTKLSEFVRNGKEKIINYYNQQAPQIFLKAQNLAQMKSFEEAIWMLMTIPSECTYYQQALERSVLIYKEYLKQQCFENLAAAKAAWMANYDREGALEASTYLSFIYPDSGCYEEAETLYSEIKSRMREDYNFEMKKYEDNIALQRELIDAVRKIGVAYGENQKSHDTNIGFLH